jgi:hypothetical protein
VPVYASNYGRTGSSENGSTSWIAGALALPAAGLVQLLVLVPIIIFFRFIEELMYYVNNTDQIHQLFD